MALLSTDHCRPRYWDLVTFHWAGFSADMRSLEAGGWNVSTYADSWQRGDVIEARHRSLNLAFRQHLDYRLLSVRHMPSIPLDFSKAFQPPAETVPELLKRILILQAD